MDRTIFCLCPRVREAAMTSLMEVTLLIASSAPEILSPELWVLNLHHTLSHLTQVVFYLSENSMHQLVFCNSIIVSVSLSKPLLNFEDLSVLMQGAAYDVLPGPAGSRENWPVQSSCWEHLPSPPPQWAACSATHPPQGGAVDYISCVSHRGIDSLVLEQLFTSNTLIKATTV